jgi:hypothetical protein
MTPNLLQYLSRPLRPHATLLALWAVCGILLSIFDSQSRNVSFPYDTAYRLLVIGAPKILALQLLIYPLTITFDEAKAKVSSKT